VAFREISTMDVWEVLRRWHDRHSISKIAQALGYDRKTVRRHIHIARSKGLSLDSPLPAREEVLRLLGDIDSCGGRTPEAQTILEQYREELEGLVNDRDLGLTPKDAF
jgi:hypothetical protein